MHFILGAHFLLEPPRGKVAWGGSEMRRCECPASRARSQSPFRQHVASARGPVRSHSPFPDREEPPRRGGIEWLRRPGGRALPLPGRETPASRSSAGGVDQWADDGALLTARRFHRANDACREGVKLGRGGRDVRAVVDERGGLASTDEVAPGREVVRPVLPGGRETLRATAEQMGVRKIVNVAGSAIGWRQPVTSSLITPPAERNGIPVKPIGTGCPHRPRNPGDRHTEVNPARSSRNPVATTRLRTRQLIKGERR